MHIAGSSGAKALARAASVIPSLKRWISLWWRSYCAILKKRKDRSVEPLKARQSQGGARAGARGDPQKDISFLDRIGRPAFRCCAGIHVLLPFWRFEHRCLHHRISTVLPVWCAGWPDFDLLPQRPNFDDAALGGADRLPAGFPHCADHEDRRWVARSDWRVALS